MNLLKKIQEASKSKAKTLSKKIAATETSAAPTMVDKTILNGDLTEIEVTRRKAEFLELLAKEERAHRVKLAELRNEPIENRRAEDKLTKDEIKTDAEPSFKTRTPLPPVSPSFEDEKLTPISSAKPSAKTLDDDPSFTTKMSRPTEAETRAAIGKQLGGNNFLMGSQAGFQAPDFSTELAENAKHKDITPLSFESRSAAQRDKTENRSTAQRQKPPAKKISRAETKDIPTQKDEQPKEDRYADMDFSRPIKGGRANVSELRLDVSRITSDIENGDALYRRAQQRVQGLMHFVERAEVDFSLLERIEPENRRLKARNVMITKELEDIVRKTALLESDLDEHRRRLAEVNVQYDTVNGNLAKAMKALSERDHEIRQLTNDISAATLKLDREKTTTEVEVRENNVLRDRVVNLTNDLEDTKASRAETIKIVESLKIDLEDHRNARERISDEAYDLRHALDEAQKQNNQMKGEMVALHQDISTFKTQYEFNLISRDDRIILLEAQIEDLARQLQIKEDIVTSAARDVTDLRKSRTGGALERERLEKIIDTQTIQLEMAQKQILESQSAMEEMDARYRDVAAALSITQNRRAQQVPSSTPDIHPEMDTPDDSARAQISDDYGTRDKDIIEDHIMDYKLGLRKSMIPTELQSKLDDLTPKQDDISTPETPSPQRNDDFDTLDQDTIEDRIMDYKLGLRKNIF